MHISIEGLDGAGKTETAKRVAQRLGFEFIQKPIQLLMDNEEKGLSQKVLYSMRNEGDNNFRALFLGSIHYYMSTLIQGKNVVTDRYIASNYYKHNDIDNKMIFDFLVSLCAKPDLTIVLYASDEERLKRIKSRNPNDKDIVLFKPNECSYDNILKFMEQYSMRYLWLDTTNVSIDKVVEIIIEEVNKI